MLVLGIGKRPSILWYNVDILVQKQVVHKGEMPSRVTASPTNQVAWRLYLNLLPARSSCFEAYHAPPAYGSSNATGLLVVFVKTSAISSAASPAGVYQPSTNPNSLRPRRQNLSHAHRPEFGTARKQNLILGVSVLVKLFSASSNWCRACKNSTLSNLVEREISQGAIWHRRGLE